MTAKPVAGAPLETGLAGSPLPAERFTLGGKTPRLAFAPADAAALAMLQRRCDETGAALVVHGGSTLQSIGAEPQRYDVALVTRGLREILAYEPRDLVVGVEAGVTLAELDRTLAAHGQFVPLDAPLPSHATVGGTLAAGWLGPRRGVYGRPRDLVIGTTAALADGTLTHAGGMVVKNVTGYDVSKLFAGSLGTLGTLVRVNLKTLPRPPAMRVATAPLPEHTRARALEHLAQMAVEPTAALWIGGFDEAGAGPSGAEGRLLFVLEGTAAVVDRATRELRSALGATGIPQTGLTDAQAPAVYQRVLDAAIAVVEQRSVTFRIPGSADTTLERVRALEELARMAATGLDLIADLRNGDVHARFVASSPTMLASELPELAAALRARLAPATVVAGARGTLDPWGPPPASLPTLRALKTRFDPNGTLAPGRYVGAI